MVFNQASQLDIPGVNGRKSTYPEAHGQDPTG